MNIAEFISQIRWRPGIGDPSFMGWLTVLAYALAAVLCLISARRYRAISEDKLDRHRRHLWFGVALLMSFLCLNKQLDLQSLFTDVGRLVAARGGWYDQRRAVQLWFVVAVAMAGIVAFLFVTSKTRSILGERKMLLFGLSFLLSFIIIRAASFHHVGVIFGSEVLGLRVNWILELGGIFLVALSAFQSIRRPKAG